MKMKLLSLAIAATFTANVLAHGDHVHGDDVLETYADIALANYSDSLSDAKKLHAAIKAFAENPTDATLTAAKNAWLQSRESYGQTEAFRLSNGPIDAEEGWVAEKYGALEGQLNAWPLDENMIDYTIDADGKKTAGNIIDSTGLFNPGGEEPKAIDITEITVDAITELNENGGDANVASGYHAIEFLLWGQDQDYANFIADDITKGALVAGQRPLSDFTTDTFAKRRLAYLNVAAEKIVNDLTVITKAWEKTDDSYRMALLGKGDNAINEKAALKDIFAGLGVFMKSELANERIAVAVLTPSEEDEHSCFSDNTHRDIVTNYQGFKNILLGEYNGKKVGAAPFDALSGSDKKAVRELMGKIEARIAKVDELAKHTMHFDYQIMPQNEAEAKNIVSLKNDMRRLGDKMVIIAKAFGISLSQDDVTDPEETKL